MMARRKLGEIVAVLSVSAADRDRFSLLVEMHEALRNAFSARAADWDDGTLFQYHDLGWRSC